MSVPAWAGDPLAGSRFDRQAVEMPRYAQVEARFDRQARRLVRSFVRGDIDESRLVSEFRSSLRDAEVSAFVAGRRANGTASVEVTEAEAKMLTGRHSRNMRFFNRFVRDMKEGRGRMDYERRASLYAKSLWSLYSRGESVGDWEDPESENVRYEWILDVDAEHCDDCLQRARLSREEGGFSWAEMVEMGWPGETTDCQTRCRCSVVAKAKRAVLPERYEPATKAASAGAGIKTLEELLGGEQMPLRIPVAGLPGAKASPEVIEGSLAASPQAAELARQLPLLPKALARPAIIEDVGEFKRYAGYGLDVLLGRDEKGLWRVLLLALLEQDRRTA